jgi:hypothetical protein
MYVLRSKLLGVDSDRSWKIQWFQYGAELGRSSKRDVLCIVLFLISSGAAIHAHGHKVFVQFVLRDDEFSPIRWKHHVSGGSSIAYSRNIRLHFPDSGAGARFPYEPLPCDRNFEFLSTGNFSSCAALLNCVRQFNVDGCLRQDTHCDVESVASHRIAPQRAKRSASAGIRHWGCIFGIGTRSMACGRTRSTKRLPSGLLSPQDPTFTKGEPAVGRGPAPGTVTRFKNRISTPGTFASSRRIMAGGHVPRRTLRGRLGRERCPSFSLSFSPVGVERCRQHERSFLPLFAHSARSVTGIYEAIDYVPCRRFDPLPPVPPPSGQLSRLSHENNVKVRPSAERAVPSFAGETNCRD